MAAMCVYCASAAGTSAAVQHAAHQLGRELARRDLALVYGGGRVGLMGMVADAALAAGGRTIGVMTQALVDIEIAHNGLSELHIVKDMHERKLTMSAMSDGFIALPGGPGTFEEMFEQWTWGQLGLHRKPCGFLDVDGFFDPLRQLIEHMQAFGYLSRDHAGMIIFEAEPERLLGRFADYQAPAPKWQAAVLRGAGQP